MIELLLTYIGRKFRKMAYKRIEDADRHYLYIDDEEKFQEFVKKYDVVGVSTYNGESVASFANNRVDSMYLLNHGIDHSTFFKCRNKENIWVSIPYHPVNELMVADLAKDNGLTYEFDDLGSFYKNGHTRMIIFRQIKEDDPIVVKTKEEL